MQVVRSNQVEVLAQALAERLRSPLPRVLDTECVLVHSPGMESWLAQQIAGRLGVCANVRFPYPRMFVPELFETVLGAEARSAQLWQGDGLLWWVLAALPDLKLQSGETRVRRYIESDDDGVKRLQLAQRIARVLRDYATYRPDLLNRWELGDVGTDRDEPWQAALFADLVGRIGAAPLHALWNRFVARVSDPDVALPGLPTRLSILGVSTLPPFHLRVLDVLSRRVDVCLYLLAPSREYFADIRSPAAQAKRIARSGSGTASGPQPLHLTTGHPLLAAWGRVGSEFQELLEAHCEYEEGADDLFVDPGTDTLLHALQSDVLHLRDRHAPPAGGRQDDDADPDPEHAPLDVPTSDASIEVHACHGALRQLEVLHDRVLARLDDDPTLQPHDFIVLMPDVETYAPLVDAVFGREPGPRRLPYQVADRSVRHDNDLTETLLAVLDLATSRAKATTVLDLLARPRVHARFGIATAELDTILRWVVETGIRWGADEAHRALVGAPGARQNTWHFGLDRLLLGYALPGAGERIFGGVLPYDEVEGSEAALAGRLAQFCETLFALLERLREARPPAAWSALLGEMLDALVAPDEDAAWQDVQVRAALSDVAEGARAAGLETDLTLAQVRTLLRERFEARGAAGGFVSGGVTFCAMLPMRSIPFRVVCVLGLEEGSFPRGGTDLPFDLVARTPRAGDRSGRHDDRYLFLEALLSARQHLLLLYSGQDPRTNETRPPSAVVEELLDAVDRGFRFEGGGSAREQLVVRHPLQPFSPRCFGDDARLASFEDAYLAAAQSDPSTRTTRAPLVTGPLRSPVESSSRVDVADLARFLVHPVRWFLETGLGVRLHRPEDDVVDQDPLELTPLDAALLGGRLLDDRMRGVTAVGELERARAAGSIPHGTPGLVTLAEVAEQVDPLAERTLLLASDGFGAPREIDLEIGGHTLVGRVGSVAAGRLITCRYARPRARHLLTDWVSHLALCAALGKDAKSAALVTRPASGTDGIRTAQLGVPGDPRALLADLLALYDLGHRVLVPLFAESSLAYMQAVAKGQGEYAIERALSAWASRPFSGPGEGADAYLFRVYRGRAPFDPSLRFEAPPTGRAAPATAAPRFGPTAERVFGPLLDHMGDDAPATSSGEGT